MLALALSAKLNNRPRGIHRGIHTRYVYPSISLSRW